METDYRTIEPKSPVFRYVKSFWKLVNASAASATVVIVPDGFFDLIFSRSETEPFHTVLIGLGTGPEQKTIEAYSTMFGISLKLPAAEYVLHTPVAALLNYGHLMPPGYWDMGQDDLTDFDRFCNKALRQITGSINSDTDSRKIELFDLIYGTDGAMKVADMASAVHWSSRQINRYFKDLFGVSLKAYCNILRYRASFKQIKEGKLFPEQYFADQAHFIRDIKRYSGVTPKELSRNENDRFIQFSALPEN